MNRSLVDRRSIVSAAALWIAGLSATGVLAQGKPEKISMDGAGKWLSADCGAVKPMPTANK